MSVRTGRIGDLLAAAIIEQLGGSVAVVNRPGHDLIVLFENRWLRVEVKSTAGLDKHKRCFTWRTSTGSKAKHYLSADHCDVVALVAISRRKAAFVHVSDARAKTTHLFLQKFEQIDERETWLAAVEKTKEVKS